MASYDFIIVGGGLVGQSLALSLTALADDHLHGFKIALLDAKPSLSSDGRLLALNNTSLSFLNRLQVLEAFNDHIMPIQEVHVSAKGRFGTLRLSSEALGTEKLGAVVPASLLEKNLEQRLLATKVELLRGTTVTGIDANDEEVKVYVQASGVTKTLTAKFIFAADGSHSTIRTLLQVPTKTFDYQQIAIVTQTKLNRSHANVAYERLLDDGGAIAMLPLSPLCTRNDLDTKPWAATIWTTQEVEAKRLLELSDEDFLQCLQKTFGYRLGRFTATTKRYQYPLHYYYANIRAHERIFLLGNAAHTLHPIVALGFNLALYETAFISKRLLALSDQKVFTVSDLQQIVADLQSQVQHRMQIGTFLPRVLTNQWLTNFPGFLSQGLVLFDLLPTLKRKFMRQLIGTETFVA